MRYDVNNTYVNNKLIELGLSIPAEDLNGSLLLVLANETGYIDDCLNYIADELNEEFVLYKVNENGEVDLTQC